MCIRDSSERELLPAGRLATLENVRKAKELGFDYILLTGNPGTGVDNNAIIQALTAIRMEAGDDMILMAGKMHAAGSKEEAGCSIISKEQIQDFASAGADVILLPAPEMCIRDRYRIMNGKIIFHSVNKRNHMKN